MHLDFDCTTNRPDDYTTEYDYRRGKVARNGKVE